MTGPFASKKSELAYNGGLGARGLRSPFGGRADVA